MAKPGIIGIIAHIAGWLLFFSLPLLFMSNQSHGAGLYRILSEPAYWIFCGTFTFLFYLNSFYLIPKFYLRRKYLTFSGILILLFLGVYVLKPFDRLISANQPAREMMQPPHPPQGLPPARPVGPPTGIAHFDIVSIFLFIMIVALTVAIKINRELSLSEKKALRAEADKTEAELSFLKAQINPHFLFNTLNNIYTLAVSGSNDTAACIMKLSNIMRYVTDEANKNLVSLKDELDCIDNYIGLQKLRLGKRTPVNYLAEGQAGNIKIAPLILMSFIENVFKYGVSKQDPADLVIHIRISEARIHYYSRNRIYQNLANTERTGIGLQNTRQRLRHIYPSAHELDVNTGNGVFTVNLTLYTKNEETAMRSY